MATAQLGAVLQHLRDVTGRRQFGDESDGALLRAFLGRNDQPAFEALVQRHGPMVLRVCLRTLGNVHDAEDALQATFLLLAQQAGAIRKRESLASWLHGVAYRMATNARRAAARRRRHESRVNPAQPPDAALSAAWREIQALLDEEVERLPATLRGVFVSCALENQNCADAARRLGLQEATVWKRLSRARKLLQERLTRRGVSLAAVLAAATVGADGAAAALSRGLVGTTVQAAAHVVAGQPPACGLVPAKVLTLVKGANQAMLLSMCKTAVFLLVCTVLAGSGLGLAVLGGAGADEPLPARQPSGEAAGQQANKQRPQPANALKGLVFVGRVLDAGGKPAAGADAALLGEPKSNPPNFAWLDSRVLAHGRTDPEGRVRLTVPRAALADYREVYVIAGKAGHGLAWARAELKVPAHETLVRLAPQKTLRGRLLDVQGQPAVGVRVRVSALSGRERVGVFALPRDAFPAWPAPTTTGKDGKFTVAGLNPDLGGAVEFEGEEFTTTLAEIKTGKEDRNQEVNLTLSPARILEGVVKAADTGKPVPGARVVCLEGGRPVTAQTDAMGRYRVRVPPERRGLPSGVSAFPPEGQLYLRREVPLDWPKGAVRHRLDLTLERGVQVRGKVTDAATGKPIAGAKAMAVLTGGYLWDPGTPRVTTGADGGFTLVVPPGRRGHVLVKGPNNDYVAVGITTGELQEGKRFGYRDYPDAAIPFEAKPGTKALEVKAHLRRGATLRGKLLGPGDKPVADALMVCWNHLDHSGLWEGFARISAPVRDGTFELHGCDPEVTYPVYFLDARHKLGATARLSAKEAAGKEVTVRLRPCASAVVRYVDKEGKPLKGHRPRPSLVIRPGTSPGGPRGVYADATWLVNVDNVNYSGLGPVADGEGRCTFPALIPGATYSGFFGQKPKELTARAGETLKFDVVIEPPQ